MQWVGRKGNQQSVLIEPLVRDHSLHQDFYIDIQVKDIQNLFGVAFKLNFPADQLETLSAEKGDFLGADPVFFPDINNSAGVVSVGVSKKSGQPAANGTGIVARIKLKEKPSVAGGITIELSLTEVAANDPSGNPITLTPQNTSYVTPGPSATLEVSPASLALGSTASSQGSFSITSNVNWSVSKDATWVTVSPINGSGNGTVTVTANSANSSANPRSATVTVSGSGISRTVSVTQSGSHNTAPGTPQLLTPPHNSIAGTNQPVLVWNVPADSENDPLHFKVEIATDNGFANMIFGSPFESKANSAGFSPTPPVAAGTGLSSFTVPYALVYGDYFWRVTAWDGSVYGSSSSVWKFTMTPTGVQSMSGEIPSDYALYPNYPNPFNPTTTISFALPEAAHALVQIFDVNGREVKRLVDQMCNAGVHSVVWNGTDEAQQKVSSGIYLCRFSAGEVVFNRKLILAK